MFLNPLTSRAGINNVEQQLQMFAVQVYLMMMGKILEPKMIRNILRYLRGERGQVLLPNEQQVADEINVRAEREPEGILSMFASLSITSFNVTVITGLDESEEIVISSEQYDEIRSLNPMLANLMPIPFPGQPVMVDIAPSIFHALMSLTRPIAPSSTVANPSDSNYEDNTVEVLEVILDHADTYSSLMSRDGILITLSFLLQVEQLSSTYGLLFRGDEAENRYRPCFRRLFEDYTRILVIADANTSAAERKRLLKMLIKQYKEDRDEDYLENPLTNHYQNQYGAIRYLMHEITVAMKWANDLLEKAMKDLKKKKKEKKPISENELLALQAKSQEMARINGFLVKFKALLKKIEEERLTLFLALKKIVQTELEEELKFADTVNSVMEADEVEIIPTLIYQPESTFSIMIVTTDNVEMEISSDQYHEIRSLDLILANLMPVPFQAEASTVRVNIPASILQALVFLTRKTETQTTASSSTSSVPNWIDDDDDALGLVEALQAHLSTYSYLISRDGILITLNFLLRVEQLSIGDRYRASLRHLLEDYRRMLVITDPNTSAKERKRLLDEFIKQYRDDCGGGYLTNPLTNHYENQIAAIRYIMHEISREREYLNHLPATFRDLLRRIEQERLALFLALRKMAIKTALDEEFWHLDASSPQDGFDVLYEAYKPESTEKETSEKSKKDVERSKKREKKKEVRHEKKSKKDSEKKEKIEKKKYEHQHAGSESSFEHTSSSTVSSHAEVAMSTSSALLTSSSSSTSTSPHLSGSPRPRPLWRMTRSVEDVSVLRKNVVNHNGKDNDKDKDKEKK